MSDLLVGYLAHITTLVAGGITHHLFGKFQDFKKQKKQEKQFPIAGQYLSRFEDEAGGRQLERTGLIALKQEGLKISGSTKTGEKEWFLEGFIDDSYIFGQYRAIDKYDEGKGTFFLKINRGGLIMEGLWSGYDSENKKITGGHYKFVKMTDLAKIEKLTVSEYAKAIKVAESELGESYIQEADFRQENTFAYGASENEELIGFCVARILDSSQFAKSYPRVYETRPRAFLGIEKVGLVAAAAVNTRFQGRGIGTRLAKRCIDDLHQNGAKVLVLTAWKSSKGTNAKGLALTNGFEEVAVLDQYWHEGSLKNKYKCPVCGPPPCKCSAVIYLKYM